MNENNGDARVLITGANSGLGFAVAQELGGTGRRLVLGARTQAKADDAVARLLADPDWPVDGSRISTVVLDLGADASIAAAADTVRERFGSLDVLINCAGISTGGDGLDLRAEFRTVFETNVFGAAVLMEAFLPLLRASQHPDRRIVNVTSGAGQIGLALSDDQRFNAVAAPFPVYRASKAALNMIAAVHAKQLADEGIASILAAPGPTRTRFSTGTGGKNVHDGVKPIIRAATAGHGSEITGTLVADESTEYGW